MRAIMSTPRKTHSETYCEIRLPYDRTYECTLENPDAQEMWIRIFNGCIDFLKTGIGIIDFTNPLRRDYQIIFTNRYTWVVPKDSRRNAEKFPYDGYELCNKFVDAFNAERTIWFPYFTSSKFVEEHMLVVITQMHEQCLMLDKYNRRPSVYGVSNG